MVGAAPGPPRVCAGDPRPPGLPQRCLPPPQHGRLKVKTTEEQAEAKRLEREKKLHQYKATTEAIFEKVRRRVGGNPAYPCLTFDLWSSGLT